MGAVFRIDTLPASDGDCLWIEWGDGPDLHRMLIDGGRAGKKDTLGTGLAQRFADQPESQRHFDLVVATHIDADHINGLVPLFRNPPVGFTTDEIWFNALQHLPEDDALGTAKADELAEILDDRKVPWNTSWTDTPLGAVVLPKDGEPLPSKDIAGLTLTLLSPTEDRLRELRKEWPDAVLAAGLRPAGKPPVDDTLGRDREEGASIGELVRRGYERDKTRPNGSSIAFLAEYADRRILFGADAHSEMLVESLTHLSRDTKVKLDVCKLPHHGSAKNLSPELIAKLDCPTWIVSTNGNLHGHPDRRAIARLITRNVPTHLIFNYNSDTTREWGRTQPQTDHGYTAALPNADRAGLRYDFISGQTFTLEGKALTDVP